MGVRAPLEANLSLALGSSVVSPLDQATGYATIADQGIHIDPSPIRLVRDAFGTPVLDNRVPQEQEVISAGTAYVVTSMLESVIKEGTGYPNADIGRPAAGKTGTTSNFRDAWFVGFTPDLVTAVWLGNDDYRAMSESFGGNVPARTWARFMKAALAKTPKHDFTYPSSEVRKEPFCGQAKKYEYFLLGTEPPSCAYAGFYSRNKRTADEAPPAEAEPVAASVPERAATSAAEAAPVSAGTPAVAAPAQPISAKAAADRTAATSAPAVTVKATHRPAPTAPPVSTMSGDTETSDDRGPNSTPDPIDATPDPRASD
jgi:penicillin-binding protein 1A